MKYTETSEQYDALVLKATNLVREKIQGSRKGLRGEANALHSLRVHQMVLDFHHWDDPDFDLFLAALLHDIVEDGCVSLEELHEMGFADRTLDLVSLATHDHSIENRTERWFLMMARLVQARDEDAWRIKLADLTDNLTQCHGLSLENRKFMVEVKAPLMLRLTEGYSWIQRHRFALEKERENQLKELTKETRRLAC